MAASDVYEGQCGQIRGTRRANCEKFDVRQRRRKCILIYVSVKFSFYRTIGGFNCVYYEQERLYTLSPETANAGRATLMIFALRTYAELSWTSFTNTRPEAPICNAPWRINNAASWFSVKPNDICAPAPARRCGFDRPFSISRSIG